MFKEGDKVDLIHTIQGKYSDGKYKIQLGTSNWLTVDEKDLVSANAKLKAKHIIAIIACLTLGVMGVQGSFYFSSMVPLLFFGACIAYLGDSAISK